MGTASCQQPPAPTRLPVFSVYQTDVIYYGDHLADFVAYEFKVGEARHRFQPRVHTRSRTTSRR